MIPALSRALGLAVALLAVCSWAGEVLACACCSNRASRYVAIEKFEGPRSREVARMEFAREAFIADSAADPLIDAKDFGSRLMLSVTKSGKDMTFAFADERGRRASLTLALPDTISIFEVDPRGDTSDEGLGPVLYKEWQLTGSVRGSGALQQLATSHPTMALVLHGRGRGCTEAEHFTDWTLSIRGPSGTLTLYGALTPPSR